MSATVPQARKQSPIQKGKHKSLGKTLLQIMKNIYGADPAPWQRTPGAGGLEGLPALPASPRASLCMHWHSSKGTSLIRLFYEFSLTSTAFFSALTKKKGDSWASSCSTSTALTGATSPNFPELPNPAAASQFYLNVYTYELSSHPSNLLPAFSLQLSAWLLPMRKKENGVPVQIFSQRSREPASGWRS